MHRKTPHSPRRLTNDVRTKKRHLFSFRPFLHIPPLPLNTHTRTRAHTRTHTHTRARARVLTPFCFPTPHPTRIRSLASLPPATQHVHANVNVIVTFYSHSRAAAPGLHTTTLYYIKQMMDTRHTIDDMPEILQKLNSANKGEAVKTALGMLVDVASDEMVRI